MPQSSSNFSSNPSLQISSMAVSAPIPSFDNSGLDPAKVSLPRLQQLIGLVDTSLRLPNTPRAFMVYLLGLAIVFTGAFMHVMVAAEIMRAQFTLSQLQAEYSALEQQNGDIIFQIARDTNMARLHDRVMAQGYVPVQKRQFIFVPPETSATMAASSQESAPVANTPAQAAPTTQTSVTAPVAATNTTANPGRGQFSRWEEFWNTTLRSAFGETTASVAGTASANTTPTNTTTNKAAGAQSATPNFWSVWWHQASEQGSKLLRQFRGN